MTASLALAFAGQSHPNRLDAAIDRTVRGGLGGHPEPLHLLADLGSKDMVAGTAIGTGTVLLTALLIDWAAAHLPQTWRPPRTRAARRCQAGAILSA